MKNYEKLFENAEKPHVEARNWNDKTNEGEVPGNVLEEQEVFENEEVPNDYYDTLGVKPSDFF